MRGMVRRATAPDSKKEQAARPAPVFTKALAKRYTDPIDTRAAPAPSPWYAGVVAQQQRVGLARGAAEDVNAKRRFRTRTRHELRRRSLVWRFFRPPLPCPLP